MREFLHVYKIKAPLATEGLGLEHVTSTCSPTVKPQKQRDAEGL